LLFVGFLCFNGFMSDSLLWKRIWQKKLQSGALPQLHYSRFKENGRLSFKKIYPYLGKWFLIFVLSSFFLASLILVFYSRNLPQPDKIVRQEGFATKIYDRNGKLIYDVFKKQKRTSVDLENIPLYLRQATIAIEDKDFYKHKGFDIQSWARIIYYLFRYQRLTGGSTLTQQLVKNALLTNERRISRKIKEFILALQIESRYDKDQILQMYLNEVPYGGTTYGVEEASETYFGKPVAELNLVESAVLAGFPQRPPYYSPFGNNPTAYIQRTKDVLRRMQEDGYISEDQEKEAVALLPDVDFNKSPGTLKAPHFVMYVKKLLEEKYGERMVEEGGLKVITSLDLDFQEKIQATVSAEIAKVEKMHITNGAAVVLDPQTGEILAMVGSKNYDDPNYDGKVNVTTSLRQPGSAIKPVTYVTALKRGYTLATLLMDVKTTFPGGGGQPEYVPENYDGKEHGPILLRNSLGNSINITAVKLLALLGMKPVLETAYDMGISTLEPTKENIQRLGLSLTLGGGEVRLLELTGAYSAFANGGLRVNPTAILKVTDRNDNILEEIIDWPQKRVLSPQEAFLISDALADNKARLITFSENNALVIPNRQVAVKTGTTNDKRDNWTIGWTPQVIVGVWVGNNDNSQMKQLASGISGAAPIWRKIILEFLKEKPVVDFQVPEEIVTAEVDEVSGYRSHDGFPTKTEYFISGTEPHEDDPVHLKMKVCKASGKIATPVDLARGDYEEKEYFVFKEDDPTASEGGPNRWQEAIDRWVSQQTDGKYHPPTQMCESENQIEVRINEPGDHSQVNKKFTVKIEPILVNEVVKIEILVDGQTKETFTSTPYERDLNLNEGTHTIKVRVHDNKGGLGEKEIKIGVNVPWDYVVPTPTPLPSPTVFTLSPTPTP